MRLAVVFLVMAPIMAMTAARAGQAEDAADFIRNLGDETVATLAATDVSQDERIAKYQVLVERSFAMKTIARYVLGRNWRAATPEQQTEYLELFRAFVIDNYASKLDSFSGTVFRIVEAQALDEKDTIVSTEVQSPGNPPVLIGYRVRVRDGKYRIIDVIVEGVSLVATQRSEFASVVDRNGIEGLLELLRERQMRAAMPVPPSD
jgi:phospholipid transport system substrate-binding protein